MFPIAKILLPVDFSERANQAVRFAVPVAERFHSEIILLHVLPPYREFGAMELASAMTDILANRRSDAEQRIAGFLRAELAPHRVRRLLLDGDPASEIVDCARREEAGLIVMPTHGYGPFRRLLLGSVTAKVLHDADCPVWTTAHAETPAAGETALKRILCAIDLSPSGSQALKWSAQLAAEFGAHLVDFGRAGSFDRRGPQMEADPGRLHRIVGNGVRPAGKLTPLGNERAVLGRLECVKIIPRDKIAADLRAHQRRQFRLVDRERHHWNVARSDALICQFAEEMNIGIAGNGRDDGGAATLGEAANALDD